MRKTTYVVAALLLLLVVGLAVTGCIVTREANGAVSVRLDPEAVGAMLDDLEEHAPELREMVSDLRESLDDSDGMGREERQELFRHVYDVWLRHYAETRSG